MGSVQTYTTYTVAFDGFDLLIWFGSYEENEKERANENEYLRYPDLSV